MDTDLTLLSQILSQRKAELAPQMDEAEFFEFFAAEQVLRDYQLDPDEIRFGIVSQLAQPDQFGTDAGIDAMYLLVNGRLIRDSDETEDLKKQLKQNIVFDVIILQASKESGFSMKRLLRLKDTSDNIFMIDRQPEEFVEKYNGQLLECIKRFREIHKAFITKRPTIQVSYFYVTFGNSAGVEPSVDGKARLLEKELPNLLRTITKCNFKFVGARDLIDLYRKPPKSTFTLKCSECVAPVEGGYLALVSLPEFNRFITSEKNELLESLFEANVRDYQGDVDVNNEIRKTLQTANDKADFWWLNNGITVIASKIAGHLKELTVDEPQIVNGLQTSIEIYEYFHRSPQVAISDKRRAVVRLIESPEVELQDRIIKATNSQTKIPPQSLWATDELQRDIEQAFRAAGMHYDRRKNSWRKLAIPLDKVVGMTELAQSVAAIYLQEPNHARARPSRYFKREFYKRAYSSKLPMDLYVNCATLRKKTEEFIRKAEPDRRHRINLLFYVAMAAACLKFKTPRANAKSLGKTNACAVEDSLIQESLKLVRPIYGKYGQSDNAAKGTQMIDDLKAVLRTKFGRKGKPPQGARSI